jgi:carboxylesterase type B
MFLADWVDTKEDFTQFLAYAFPGDALASIRQKIETQYPAKLFDFQQKQRMRHVLRDSTFVCNKRQIYNAFHNDSSVYTAKFEMPPAQHGFDMFAIIWHYSVSVSDLIKYAAPKVPDYLLNIFDSIWPAFAPRYQKYFAGHALTGDPNYLISHHYVTWERTVDDGNRLTNSMMMGRLIATNPPFFKLSQDPQSSTENCAFWDEVANDISKVLGKKATPIVNFREQLELR